MAIDAQELLEGGMSDLLEDIEVDYPKTVTVCHAEISRLTGLLSKYDAVVDRKDAEIAELVDKIEDLEENYQDVDVAIVINRFLDECERVGPLRFDVPQSDRANRAIVALHDAVGRQP
jgi:hypothetical protein